MDRESVQKIKWGGIKSPQRACEKVMRSYRGDVSMLLDVCRQMIIFDTVDELCEGLSAVLHDRHVTIVRIKNRLRADYDCRDTYGYRDVSINLRIHNSITAHLGLQNHVCELKLVLSDFYHIMVSFTNSSTSTLVCSSNRLRSLSRSCARSINAHISFRNCAVLSGLLCLIGACFVPHPGIPFHPELTGIGFCAQSDDGHQKYVMCRNMRGE